MGGPDFVGVGVQKAGTSWWYSLLCAHPQCAADPLAKELHFFDRYWAEPFGEDAIAAYRRGFAGAYRGCTGEWTPRYLHDPWVPPLLRAAAPKSRLVVLLRDPIERYRSGLTHSVGHDGWPPHPLLAADAFSRGLYGQQLERLYRSFDPAQVLVLQYEACVADPARELQRTYEFLGLDPTFRPPAIGDRVRRTAGDKAPLPPHVAAALAEAYAGDLELLAKVAPHLDLGRWPTAGAGR